MKGFVGLDSAEQLDATGQKKSLWVLASLILQICVLQYP